MRPHAGKTAAFFILSPGTDQYVHDTGSGLQARGIGEYSLLRRCGAPGRCGAFRSAVSARADARTLCGRKRYGGSFPTGWCWPVRRGALVWFADQPTVGGYNPLLEMFWDPGFLRLPVRDGVVLLFSWLVTTLFCHLVLFAVQRAPPASLASLRNHRSFALGQFGQQHFAARACGIHRGFHGDPVHRHSQCGGKGQHQVKRRRCSPVPSAPGTPAPPGAAPTDRAGTAAPEIGWPRRPGKPAPGSWRRGKCTELRFPRPACTAPPRASPGTPPVCARAGWARAAAGRRRVTAATSSRIKSAAARFFPASARDSGAGSTNQACAAVRSKPNEFQ